MHNLVIADTSCLIVLEQIGRLSLLKKLYDEIHITSEIKDEYGSELPGWITVAELIDKQRQKILELNLDKGEASAIALGLENEGSLLLIDEKKGRNLALSLGLKITGTLGILIKAKNNSLISSLREEFDKLKNVGFWVSDKLLTQILDKYENE